jgi:RNA polymerase sigma factor (sigma-70 family)
VFFHIKAAVTLTEIQTYKLLRDKGKDGVKVLYERYGKKLYAYAIHSWKLGEDDAWELVYQLLYNICEKIDRYTFDNEKTFASFLFTAFMNLLRNHVRDNKHMETESIESYEGLHIGSAAEQDENNDLVLLKHELEKMEDWERILLLLRCQEMPYAEIAKYTGKPADQLKVYYGRLKDRLGKRLQELLEKQKAK